MPSEFNMDLVGFPSRSGGRTVKLVNEMVFAQFNLSLSEQKLLYYAMSHFDIDSFLTDSDVCGALTSGGLEKQDLSKVTPTLLNKYYWCPELRSIRIPVASLMNYVSGTSAGNWKLFDNAVDALGGKQIYIRMRDDGREHHRIRIFGGSYYINNRKEVVLSFTQEFMPYLVAFKSYKKVNLGWLAKLNSKYAPRFLHYFMYALDGKNSAVFNINVKSLRERLNIKDDELKRGFYERVIKKSLDDIKENIPEISASVTIKRDSSKRGRPVIGYAFSVKVKDTLDDFKPRVQTLLPLDDDEELPF